MIKTIKKYLSGCLKLVPMRHSEPAKQMKNLNAMKNKILRLSLKMTDKLSGCLKNCVGNAFAKLPTLRLLMILCLFTHTTYAQNDIAKTENYLPNGKYRLFGGGRGEVQNIDNQIRLHGQLTQQAGNLSIETRLYQGDLSYQQHFQHHGHSVHAPFENKAQRNFSAKTGSVVQGGATLTDLSVTGYEIHPADAYDGEQGGGYPVPTGARDEYLYEVQGKEVSVKVVALDKLPPKANDNQLLQAVGIDPTAYNQPQTQDNHTQIERISFANATNSNAYGDFVDLTHNGQGWESVANPMPITSWSLPAPERGAAYYSHPSITFVRIVPQTRATLGKPTPYDHDPNAPMVSHVSAPIPKYNPYDYPTSLPLFDNPLHKGKGSSSAGNSGNDNKQNDDNNPPVLGYYYGDDDELYFYSNDDYYGNSYVSDDYDNLLNLVTFDHDDNDYAYPINAPYGLAYYANQNEQNSESSWWDTGKYFTPIYGDYLSFKEAETFGDYFLATIGIIPSPWTKGAKGVGVANKVNKARKAVDKADDAAGKTNNVGKNSKRAPEYDAGETTESGFVNSAEKWLGKGYTEAEKGRYVSQDGMRQVRYGNHETKSPNNHHGHFEAYDKPAQQGGKVYENSVVKILPDN